ncbi:MAG: uroporphyrinogen decarboxylase family protein [Anaerolineae bacterium]|nr:uroporphyrinogen decarboxylase family protein [Anaerolineae bacterium]
MNPRERFHQTIAFGLPDKIPFNPGGPRESTLAAWRQQGLPEDQPWHDALMEILGIEEEKTQPKTDLGVSFRMIPTFEEKVLAHKNGHYIVQDWMGAVTEISDAYDYTYIRSAKDFVTRKWHSFPVKTRQDWEEKIRWRYEPRAASRFPDDFDTRCAKLRERDYVLGLTFSGPFWQLREWCGMEGLCLMMIEQPDFVTDMVQFWSDFVLATLTPILSQAPPDWIQFNEDMAYKMHSMISPRMVRQYLLPTWKEWIDAIKSASPGTKVLMDSDGYVGELIPLWVEAGFDACTPMEVAAGNDIVADREAYGTRIAFLGGIDKRALAKGGQVMRHELDRVIPPLLLEGGFIPGCDHGVPPDISWPNFIEYSRYLAHYTGWL